MSGAPLPAGLYFRGYNTCEGCAPPTHVVVWRLVKTVAEATRAADDAREVGLPFGYPMVVHTDEIGVDGGLEGIAIISGMFPSEAEARGWQTGGRVVALTSDNTYWSGPEERRTIVRIVAGNPDPAFAAGEVERLQEHADNWSTEADRDAAVAALKRIRPLCTLAPDSIHLWDPHTNRALATYYRWAPVHCGKKPAYVRWTDTLLHATIIREPNGGHKLVQVVGAECDRPFFEEWPYSEEGKGRSLEPTLVARGGC